MGVDREAGPAGRSLWSSSRGRLERARQAWEQAASSGDVPRIGEYLSGVADTQRPALFRGLLQLEVVQRQLRGETICWAEYNAQYPDLTDVISEVSSGVPTETDLDPGAAAGAEDTDPTREFAGRDLTHRYSTGDRIGRYIIHSALGGGSFGTVYKALDDELKRTVAIKIPHRELVAMWEDTERLFDEARTVAGMNHPGINALYDVIHGPEGEPLLIMEYLEGGSLRNLMESGSIDSLRAAQIVEQVAEAVHHAHCRGFVHRDLKPANILLDADGRTRIADFGLAVHEDVQRLHAGERSGTTVYMAPEQVRGEVDRLDGRTDIWALGVILYEMLCGRRPFTGTTREEVEEEILHRDAKPPRQIHNEIPAELERICLKCLAKNMTERYATGRDLAGELHRWRQPRRSASLALAMGVGLAVVLMAVLTVWLLRPHDKSRTSEKPSQAETAPPLMALPRSSPQATLPSEQPAQPTPPAISGTLDVLVWAENDLSRRGLKLSDEGSLPLRPGDRVRIEAKLNREAYVYLLWIDASGAVAPVYPWQHGDWSARPEEEIPVDHLSLPDIGNEGWAVQPPLGTETLVLLARDTPLPQDVQFAGLLDGLPSQHMRDPSIAAWFNEGKLETRDADQPRSIDLKHTQRIDDSLLASHRRLEEILFKHFQLRRAVSFASSERE